MMNYKWLWAVVFILVFLEGSTGRVSAFSLQKEIQVGKDASKEVEKQMPPSTNQKWQHDINEMGQRIAALVQRKGITYHFTVVQAKQEINAFALPGGYVYFTERMWKIMDPDERAAILAHEIIHCDRRHGIDMMLKSQQRALWMLPVIILSGGGALGNIALFGSTIIDERYSRKMEREADELGIKLCTKAGYNPAGAVTSMKKLLNIESNTNRYEVSALFASHPDTKKRIDYLSQEATSLGANASDMTLKSVDDPSRLGNITSIVPDMNTLFAKTSIPLAYGQTVAIKKTLWDDDLQALAPKTVATATVLTPGTHPILLVNIRDIESLAEIMVGDGVFPAAAVQSPKATKS
ncbi:MAG: M48 family metalloprotease [Armatimonadota bacterium]|nr:M48 family metalloprotease [bacterium]